MHSAEWACPASQQPQGREGQSSCLEVAKPELQGVRIREQLLLVHDGLTLWLKNTLVHGIVCACVPAPILRGALARHFRAWASRGLQYLFWGEVGCKCVYFCMLTLTLLFVKINGYHYFN